MKRSLLALGGAGLVLLALLWVTVIRRPPVSQASALPRSASVAGEPADGASGDQTAGLLGTLAIPAAVGEAPTGMDRTAAAPTPPALPPALPPIEVTVVNARSGQPIVDAGVNLAGVKFYQRTFLRTDADGRVQLPARFPLSFKVTHEGCLPLRHQILEAPIDGQARVELLPFIRLHGRIVGAPSASEWLTRGRVMLMMDDASLGRMTQLQVVAPEDSKSVRAGITMTENGIWSIDFLPVPTAFSGIDQLDKALLAAENGTRLPIQNRKRTKPTREVRDLRVIYSTSSSQRELAVLDVVQAGDELEIHDPWSGVSPCTLQFVDQERRPLPAGGLLQLCFESHEGPLHLNEFADSAVQLPLAPAGTYHYTLIGDGVSPDSEGVLRGSFDHDGSASKEVVVDRYAEISGRLVGQLQRGMPSLLLVLVEPGGEGPTREFRRLGGMQFRHLRTGAVPFRLPLLEPDQAVVDEWKAKGNSMGSSRELAAGLKSLGRTKALHEDGDWTDVSEPFVLPSVAAETSFDLLLLRADSTALKSLEVVQRIPVHAGDTDVEVLAPGPR